MGEGRKAVITFDLQLYERAVKLQMHKAPTLNNLVFRIGEMHTVMTSLRALGTSIDDSGFDDAWIEANLYSSTTTRQILEGRHMKRALTAHSITSSALCDLHLSAFLKTEVEQSSTVHDNLQVAASMVNSACQEHKYDELDNRHKQLLDVIDVSLIDKLNEFDAKMETSHPTFKFARDYMKFVAWIWMFIRATREGNWKLHLESLRALCKYFFAHDRQNYTRMVPLYLAQMEKLETNDPDIYTEFMAGNFCVYKNEVPFCAIGPDHGIEHENKVMKILGGLKGLTQQPAAMARWFLIAPELSRLGNEAEHLVGKVSQRSVSHHDLSDAKLKRYEENVGKLREVLKVNDPFIIEDDELINIVTHAIMPEVVKQAVIQRDSVGEEMFEKFVQERLVNLELNVWSPMKKANLKTWKTARMVKKSKKAVAVTAIKNERALFARFLVVILSRPDLDLKKSISEFEFAEYPHSLFTFDGILRSCVAKSKLMTILERLPDQQQLVVAQEEQTQHGRVTIIDAMAVVQSMGKPTWVKTGYDLANHFLHVLDCKSQGFHEVHIVFDRYDIPNSLKERTRNLRLGDHRSLAYNTSDEPIIEKVTLKQLLNNQDNKQRLTLYLASHILKHRKESEKIYVTTLSEECKSNKLILFLLLFYICFVC